MHCPVSLRCISPLWHDDHALSITPFTCIISCVRYRRSETWQINNVNISWRRIDVERGMGRERERETKTWKKKCETLTIYIYIIIIIIPISTYTYPYHFDRLILYEFSMGCNSHDNNDDGVYYIIILYFILFSYSLREALQFRSAHTHKTQGLGV